MRLTSSWLHKLIRNTLPDSGDAARIAILQHKHKHWKILYVKERVDSFIAGYSRHENRHRIINIDSLAILFDETQVYDFPINPKYMWSIFYIVNFST